VIDGLDLDLAPGKVTMIIGANASGKSTLLGTFARLRAPLSGRVELDGEDVVGIPRRRFAQTVGLLPQHPTAPTASASRNSSVGGVTRIGVSSSDGASMTRRTWTRPWP
jgi:ABC-type cobalamin/Fe3+-siderophores transport system ATPase subunit